MSRREVVVGYLEDDEDQAELISLWLEEAGYTMRLYNSAGDFRRKFASEPLDLLLLDWMLPDASGIEVIHWIRSSSDADLPVIFLTSRMREEDIVQGLMHGGDDYVTKPAKQGELLARVSSVLRRRGSVDNDIPAKIDLKPYFIDMQRRRLTIDGREIDLTQREFELAAFLFQRYGRIVSREALLENIWHVGGDVSTRTVDTHISRLRKKLELSGEHGWRLTAVYQHGYRLDQTQ